MTLKEKTLSGIVWSLVESFANQGTQFLAGIILARLLSPREFGLIGMLTFFIAVSQSFIDSGFTSALIRKRCCTQTDYSTVFFFNLFAGLGAFLILFVCSGSISTFFGEPDLKLMLQILAFGLVLAAVSGVQQTILMRR